jgi:hypothetical protein
MKLESTLMARRREVEKARAVRGVVKRVDAAKRGKWRSLEAMLSEYEVVLDRELISMRSSSAP